MVTPKFRRPLGVLLAAVLGLTIAAGAASAAPPAGPTDDSRPLEIVPAAITAQPELIYVPVTPCRIVDTRSSGAFGKFSQRSFYVAGTFGFLPQGGKSGGCGIPLGAKVVSATFSAIDPGAVSYGYLRAWAAGTSEPQATLLNYRKDRISIGGQIPLRTGAGSDLTMKNYAGTTDLVIDVNGYYIQQLQAYISPAGSVIDQSGRLVSATKNATGQYSLVWDRDISSCSGQGASDYTGRIVSVYTSGKTSYVYVVDNAGTSIDYYTNVLINC